MPYYPKILVVDDDERFADLVVNRLQTHAACTVANNGEDALLQFEHHLREKAPFQAVLMDIKMPHMDGHEVVKKMRMLEEQNNVPPLNAFKLVMLTAHKDATNVSKSFFQGRAEAYIVKDHLSNADKFISELEKHYIL